MLPALKILLVLIWLALIASLFIDSDHVLVRLGPWMLLAMAVVHVIEFFLFRGTLNQARGSISQHFLLTFIFGALHFSEVKQALRQRNQQDAIV